MSTKYKRDPDSTKILREKNIEAEAAKPREVDKSPGVRLEINAEDIRKRLFPEPALIKRKINYMVLRDQEKLLVEWDSDLYDLIVDTYINPSKHGRGALHATGDKKKKNLYMSDVSKCPREIFYAFFEPETARDYTFKGLCFFGDGNMHHEDIQSRLKTARLARNPEGYLELDDPHCTGYYDDLIHIKYDEKAGIEYCDMVEIKTKMPSAIDNVKQSDYDQAQLYHYAAQHSKRLKSKNIKIQNIVLIYKDRSLMSNKIFGTFRVQPDPDRCVDVLNYFRWLEKMVVGEKFLCAHPYERKSTKCQYCKFVEHCWAKIALPPVKLADVDTLIAGAADAELVDSLAQKLRELITLEKDISKEIKTLTPAFLGYMLSKKLVDIAINETEKFTVRHKNTTEWNRDFLKQKIGEKYYSFISTPNAALIKDLIKRFDADASVFEQAKTIKQSKPFLAITKINNSVETEEKEEEETNAD